MKKEYWFWLLMSSIGGLVAVLVTHGQSNKIDPCEKFYIKMTNTFYTDDMASPNGIYYLACAEHERFKRTGIH